LLTFYGILSLFAVNENVLMMYMPPPPLALFAYIQWNGTIYTSNDSTGKWFHISAPIGYPPVFYQQGSKFGEELRYFVVSRGYTTMGLDYLTTSKVGI
jgi:hypothetical protein